MCVCVCVGGGGGGWYLSHVKDLPCHKNNQKHTLDFPGFFIFKFSTKIINLTFQNFLFFFIFNLSTKIINLTFQNFYFQLYYKNHQFDFPEFFIFFLFSTFLQKSLIWLFRIFWNSFVDFYLFYKYFYSS